MQLRKAPVTQNYSVGFSGGNENGKFRASFLASDNQGFIKKSNLKKYLASFNGQYNFLDNKLTLEFGLVAANYGEGLVPIGNTSGSTGSLVGSALSWNPTTPFTINGMYNYPSTGSGNPLAESDATNDNSNVSEFLSHGSISYKILPNLTYKFLYGINYGTGVRKFSIDGWLQGFPGVSGQGFAAIFNQQLRSSVLDHTLNYQANLSKNLTLDALAGFEYYKTDIAGGGLTASGFNTNLTEANRIDIPYTSLMQNAKTQNPYFTFANPSSELQSYFGRVTLNYQDKILVTGTIRA